MDDNAGFCFEIKQECKDDLLEVVDNLKQEEPTEQTKEAICLSAKETDSMFQPFQSEYKCENIVIVSDYAQSTDINIKQECKEEDPLSIPDVLDLKQEVQSTETCKETTNKHQNCDKCNKSFTKKDHLKTHIQSIHENVRYNCDKCDKSFTHKSSLRTHIRSAHKNVQCDKCNKNFSDIGNLKKHIQSVHENIRYNCDKCNKSFSLKGTLTKHIQSVHQNVRYNCDKCDKSFLQKGYLNRHTCNKTIALWNSTLNRPILKRFFLSQRNLNGAESFTSDIGFQPKNSCGSDRH